MPGVLFGASAVLPSQANQDDLLWLRPPLRGLTLATLALAFAAIGPENGFCLRADCRTERRSSIGNASNKKPSTRPGFLFDGCLTMTYFRMGNPHYHRRATVSRSCSGWEGVVPAGYGRQALTVGRARKLHRRTAAFGRSNWIGLDRICANTSNQNALISTHGYGVKPHGQLVSVSLTHYCASTPDLSTWWSATTL